MYAYHTVTSTKWSPGIGRRVRTPRRRRDAEMPEPADPADSELVAEELLRELFLNLPVDVVQEDVGVALPSPRARHGRGRPYRRHPAGRRREVALGRVHHDHVPLRVVHLRRQGVQRERARRVAAHRHGAVPAFWEAGGAGAVGGEEGVGVVEAGAVRDEVRPEERRPGPHSAVPLGVLLQEHGGAAGVERVPERRVVAQAEHQQPQRRAAAQHGQRQRDLRPRLLRHRRRHGVRRHRVGQRRHARGGVPGPRGRGDGGEARKHHERRQRRGVEGEDEEERCDEQSARAGGEAAAPRELH
jgi:hypothetical protein